MHSLFRYIVVFTQFFRVNLISFYNKNRHFFSSNNSLDYNFRFYCRSSDSRKDDQLCARIQVEFDTFVLRSSNYIYLSRFLGAWQYLATLPFSELHIKTTWKLYYMLTSGFSKDSIENVTDGNRIRKLYNEM